MRNYELTIENGVINWINDTDGDGNPIRGVLYIPEDAASFSTDAWVFLGCEAEGIEVHADNPKFSSAHNCLLSKDGTKLIKVCKNSEISKLTGLKTIGREAFHTFSWERDEFNFRIPDGVETVEYHAFALNAEKAEITVPASVRHVDLLAFMIHGKRTHIIFEGDPYPEVGVFGTAAEAKDSDFEILQKMPAAAFPKTENITVTCRSGSRISRYCKKYGITEVQ